ncbi:hypothetical protein BH23PSE1_BH23PSE1_08010 [soil metagenome]
MIELLITACLVGGGECRDFPLLYDAREVGVLACVVRGQAEVAGWQEGHPGWAVSRWRCGAAGARGAEA